MARTKSTLGVGTVLTAALLASMIGSASADYAPSASDLVGVGSDTVQNIGNFLSDGDTAGDTGYNSAGNTNKVISFDATPDANDRAGFAFCATTAGGGVCPSNVVNLNPTITLRAGLNPVQRPNGSGAGINALIADTAHNIDFVRMSRLPSSTEYTNAANKAGVGVIKAVKISTDNLKVATATTTNAPASLTTAQLVDIYKCTTTNWSTVGGTAGVIKPIIPQAGSGTRSSFLADLKAANGAVDVPLGGCVVTGEENDPSIIKGDANAVAPFSEGRLNLYNSGFFKDPNQVYGATPVNTVTAGIKLLGGYVTNRGLYIVFRKAEGSSGSPFQAGGNASKIQDMFYSTVAGATPFVASDAGSAAIAAAGATPAYVVCADGATSGC